MKKDCLVLIDMMQRISRHRSKMWNKGKITVYLLDGTVQYSELLAQPGKHTTSRLCLYFKRLSDLQVSVPAQIVQQSYKYIKSQDWQMDRALQ